MMRWYHKWCARAAGISSSKGKQIARDNARRLTLELRSPPTGGAGGVVSLGRTTPTHAEQQGGAGDATRRRGAAFTRRQPRAATAEDARTPPRPGNPHQTTGACVTPGGARACAGGRAARAPAEQRRGRAYRSKDAPPRLPQRSRASSAERSASRPSGRAQRPRGREPGASRRAASPPPPSGASEARRGGASIDRRRRAAPRCKRGGGDHFRGLA